MEVILKKTHPHLGERGKVVKVADGYARNYLIPKDIAVPNTPGNKASIEAEGQFEEIKLEKEMMSAEQIREKIDGKEFKINAKVGKEGKLYGSITKQDITDLLESEGFLIDKKSMDVEEHIRETGIYEIQLNLLKDVKAQIKLIVEGELSEEDVETKEEDKKEEDKKEKNKEEDKEVKDDSSGKEDESLEEEEGEGG
jgi:large subunit ribosomal protein L9